MTRDQPLLTELFRDQVYGPRDGMKSRDWQLECLDEYETSIAGHEAIIRADRPDGRAGAAAHSQHQYTMYAGTGSGKTKAAGLVASMDLNIKRVGQVVVVTPNRSVKRKTIAVFRQDFGIDLVAFHANKHRDGIPRTKQGYVLTYGHLIQDPTLHRRICAAERTLVIFDEVHHLGDRNAWGGAAVEAFGLVPYVLCLTGTPYRSDNRRIPFVRYEDKPGEDGVTRFCADPPYGYRYTLGKAIDDGVCRTPLFEFRGATVNVRNLPYTEELTVTFKDTDVNDTVASLRLKGAVKYGSTDRRQMLEAALPLCRSEKRKVIIFLGGDTEGEQTPTYDATKFLPSELQEMGIGPDEYEIITGEDREAQHKIDAFGSSSKWILIAINMVSEGTDIPELSAAIFLTSWTAKQTTVQRIGRTLRLMGEDDPQKVALIYMFDDPELVALSDEIKGEIAWEKLQGDKRREQERDGNGDRERRCRAESIGIGNGELSRVKFGTGEWPADIFVAARSRLRLLGLAPTMMNAALQLLLASQEEARDVDRN